MAAAEAGAAHASRRLNAALCHLHGPQGVLTRTWSARAMGLGVMGMLLALLLAYYFA
ncbi:hypothetical protein D3C84_1273160 [compost metagenome]